MKKIILLLLTLSCLLLAGNLNLNFKDGTNTESFDMDSIESVTIVDSLMVSGKLNINFNDKTPSDQFSLENINKIRFCNCGDDALDQDQQSKSVLPAGCDTYVNIVNVNNRWIDENTIKMNIVSLLDFHDENGLYRYCPSAEMVCASMGLECLGLEYKYEDQDWILINRSIDDQTPCQFENVTIQQSATYSSLYLPYGVFFWGINRYWDDFGLNTIRGASYYNFTIMQITPTSSTIKVNLRFERDRKPQILTIPVGEKRIYDQKEDAIVFLRATNVTAKTVDVTIVQEAESTFRAKCSKCRTLENKDY